MRREPVLDVVSQAPVLQVPRDRTGIDIAAESPLEHLTITQGHALDGLGVYDIPVLLGDHPRGIGEYNREGGKLWDNFIHQLLQSELSSTTTRHSRLRSTATVLMFGIDVRG